MQVLITNLIVAVVAAGLGVAGTVWTAKRRENLSTRKEQLKFFYAPLEIMLRMNKNAFERYKKRGSKDKEAEFIEQSIWHPNHVRIKELIMNESHHLSSMPDDILDLLEHKPLITAGYGCVLHIHTLAVECTVSYPP